MEDIFFYHVLPFVKDKLFHKQKMSLLNKNKYLKERQNTINKFHCANLLDNRFWLWETDIGHNYKQHLHIFVLNFDLFMKYTIEVLLNDRDMDLLSETIHQNRHKIIVDKHVISDTIIEYDLHQKIKNIDFISYQEIIYNFKICSTYRLTLLRKEILINHYPYAKALIY